MCRLCGTRDTLETKLRWNRILCATLVQFRLSELFFVSSYVCSMRACFFASRYLFFSLLLTPYRVLRVRTLSLFLRSHPAQYLHLLPKSPILSVFSLSYLSTFFPSRLCGAIRACSRYSGIQFLAADGLLLYSSALELTTLYRYGHKFLIGILADTSHVFLVSTLQCTTTCLYFQSIVQAVADL